MKITIRILGLLLLFGLVTMSCGDDDEPDPEPTPPVEEDITVVSVSDGTTVEGESISHTVTLSGAGSSSNSFTAALADGTATSEDYDSNLANATLDNGVTYASGEFTVPEGVASFTVSVNTINDAIDEEDKTYTLTVGGQTGTGTITDDDLPPAYLLQVETQTPEGDRLVYLVVSDQIDDPIDLGEAIEIGGVSRIRSYNGKVYAFNGETLEVIRYGLDETNTPVEEDVFSMANLGLQTFASAIAFASDTRAIYVDANIQQIVIWDPTAMEIVNTIPFGDNFPASAQFDRPAVNAEGKVYLATVGLDFTTFQVGAGAQVVIIDPVAETVEVVFDETLPSGNVGLLDMAGDYYFTANTYFGIGHNFNIELQPTPAIYRILNGQNTFDPDFILDGATTNEDGYPDILHYTVSGDRYVVVAHDDSTGPLSDKDLFSAFSAPWLLYTGTVGEWNAVRVPAAEGELFLFAPYIVDGEFYTTPTFIDDRGADAVNPLYRITASGTLETVTESPGFIRLVERIR
ncbi:MAG: hypothetical protein AAGC88_00955 [Bacteroidota bacterium]